MKVELLSIKRIQFDPNQPRKEFESIQELARSIEVEGVIQPIEVTREKNGYFMVVDGERRLRACIFLNEDTIPCIIREKIDDRFIRQLVTDFHKKKLTLMEQADSIQKLLGERQDSGGGSEASRYRDQPVLPTKTAADVQRKDTSAHQRRKAHPESTQHHFQAGHPFFEGKEDEIVEEIVSGNRTLWP